jgi:hypothetical protein
MGLTAGIALLVLGIAFVALSLPRQGQLRPWVRSRLGQAMVPVLCLAFITFGVACIIFYI